MSLESFFDEHDPYSVEANSQTRLRIRLAVYAYAYEFMDDPLISDGDFDTLCKQIDLSIDTRRPDLDSFFRKNFNPSTGMWIRTHPELGGIKCLYNKFYRNQTL